METTRSRRHIPDDQFQSLLGCLEGIFGKEVYTLPNKKYYHLIEGEEFRIIDGKAYRISRCDTCDHIWIRSPYYTEEEEEAEPDLELDANLRELREEIESLKVESRSVSRTINTIHNFLTQ